MTDVEQAGDRVVIECDTLKHPVGPMVSTYLPQATEDSMGRIRSQQELIEHMLFNVTSVPTDPDKYTRNAKFIPGATLGGRVGPHRDVRLMIIGKISDDRSPGRGGLEGLMNSPTLSLLGSTQPFIEQCFEDMGVHELTWKQFYVTNMCRFPRIDAGLKKNIPVAWFKECRHLLEQVGAVGAGLRVVGEQRNEARDAAPDRAHAVERVAAGEDHQRAGRHRQHLDALARLAAEHLRDLVVVLVGVAADPVLLAGDPDRDRVPRHGRSSPQGPSPGATLPGARLDDAG